MSADFVIGDVVLVGKGKVVWRVIGFFGGHDGQTIASLKSVETESSNTSAVVDRLVLLSRKGISLGQDVTLTDERNGQVWDWHENPDAVWVATDEPRKLVAANIASLKVQVTS